MADMTFWDFLSQLIQKFGYGILALFLIFVVLVWPITHWTAQPGGRVSILWGMVEYTKGEKELSQDSSKQDGDLGSSDTSNSDPDEGEMTKPDEELTMWYRDEDEDTFGNPQMSMKSENQPVGYVNNDRDCYDSNGNVKPGQESWFKENRGDGSYDYNCDGIETQQFTIVGQCSGGEANPKGWGGSIIPACGQQDRWLVDCDRHITGVEREYDGQPHVQFCR